MHPQNEDAEEAIEASEKIVEYVKAKISSIK